jgi:anaerobic selenocysteine-containing dehydrogenase
VSDIEIIKTACRNCHGSCVADVYLKDGKIIKIKPDKDSPLSRGRMCPKGLSGIELVYHPDRLKYPMKRVGERGEGKWQRISWDEAYDILCDNINEITAKYGREAIAVGHGTGRHHMNQVIRFANTLGTPNWFEPGFAQCFFPRIAVAKMTIGEFMPCDYYGDVNPECIMVWGHNHIKSGHGGENMFLIGDAVKKGSKLIVVDPRRTELAERADLWLQVRPGSDAALAMAMVNVIIEEELYDKEFVENWTFGFEELKERAKEYPPKKVSEISWVPEEQIVEAARMFSAAKPGLMEWGLALEHTCNCIQAVRAVGLIPILTGNIDVPGGWVEGMKLMDPPDKNLDRLAIEQQHKRLGFGEYKLLTALDAPNPGSHIPTILEAMKTEKPYPIKCLLLFGNNGLLSIADTKNTYEAYMANDFICCMDLFMTPTAEISDLVLPAASWLELNEIIAYPAYSANTVLVQKQIVRTHECKSDEEVFCELSKRLGLDWGADKPEDIYNQQLKATGERYPEYKDINFERMKELNYISVPIEYRKYEKSGFKTRTGKAELYCTQLEAWGYDPLPYYVEPPETVFSQPELAKEYPLTLTTGGRSIYFFCTENRQMPSLRGKHPFPLVEIHPATAKEHGIEDGDWVYIETPRGRITQKARVTDGIDPRVINCEYGWWYPEVETPDHGLWESNANVLTPMSSPYDPAMGTYALRAFLCRIYKNEDCHIEERYRESDIYKQYVASKE